MASENAELLTEALAVILELVPLLDPRDFSHVTKVHPWATDSWLSSVLAMSQGEPTGDTKLIAQLTQQLQVQQLNIGTLEAELANATASEVDVHAPQQRSMSPPQQQYQQQQQQQQPASPRPQGSPLPQSEPPRRAVERPPKARPAAPVSPRAEDNAKARSQKQKQQRAPQPPPAEEEPAEEQQQQAPSPAPKRVPKGKAPRRPAKTPSPAPSSSALDEDDASGDGGTIPWSEFAEDGEGGTVQPADADEEAEMERRRLERGETRFNSISEELKAINAGVIDASEASTVAAVDTRQPCAHCGRKFLPERLGRHIKVCEDLKRGKEWRGQWKSPHHSDVASQKSLLTSSFKV